MGTGFHPELTGRENIQLNGAILGMTRAEIKSKFDEIVEFSEIGRFLDTPVKRYSSGMYVRLAFAVAAHLDPEILIVDEVLAVGDAGFQKKCLGKMEDVAGHGRTVLFVSHNMQAIRSLCGTAIRLEAGRIVDSGQAAKVVSGYLSQQADQTASVEWAPDEAPGDEGFRLLSVRVLDASGEITNLASTAEPITVRMDFDLRKAQRGLCIGFELATSDGTLVLRAYQTDIEPERWPELEVGHRALECTIPPGLLNDGRYSILPRVSIHFVRWIVHMDSVVSFEAHLGHFVSSYAQHERPGVVAPLLDWRLVE